MSWLHRPTEIVWFGLQDVEGTCDSCARSRKLVVEYKPTSAWICIDCFRETYQESLAS